MATVNASWTPPPLDSLSYRNCSAVVAWFSDTATSAMWLESTVISVLTYLRSSLPDNLDADPTDAQLMAWFLGDNTIDQVGQWMDAGWDRCKDQQIGDVRGRFCEVYGVVGDSDLAGPGTFIAYQLEAALVTLYAIIILFDYIHRLPRKDTPAGKVLSALQESSIEFLDSAIIFSIGLQVAGIVQTNRLLQAPTYASLYTTVISMMACLFSAFCAALLQCAVFGLRRRKQRVASWLLLLGLVLANLGLLLRLAPPDSYDQQDDGQHDQQSMWEAVCGPPPPFDPIVLGGFMAAIFIVTIGTICIPKLNENTLRDTGTLLRLGFSLTCLVVMWTLLGFITAWRTAIDQTAPGANNEDKEWTFGQILALTAWAPAVINFGFIAICGPKEGLEGRMSTRFTVTNVEDERNRPDSPPRDR
ncbi:hypothetical protein DL768_001179 [Monosporascus sp. mg162]|nr:hypothetical protein DL768_001179 [Monosporascus sp. mg162]